MEDKRIVDLYWQRDEIAIRETENRYGRYLMKIAFNVLSDLEDSRESVNDTYLKAWNSMPPHKPVKLAAFLGKITRELSIDRFRKRTSQKRQASEYALSLSELEDCVSGGETPEEAAELSELAAAIGTYLRSLSAEKRTVFVCRYFFMDSIREIAYARGVSEEKVKSMLHRTRAGLKAHLEKEGFVV